MEGNFVYLGIVIIVNFKILVDTNLHTIPSFVCQIGSIAMFLVASAIATNLRSLQMYGTVQATIITIEFYYILILMLLAIVQIDIGVNYVNRQLRKRMIRLAKTINKKLIEPIFNSSDDSVDQEDNDVLRKTHLGFAFSQAPGNAPQIVEKAMRASVLRKTDEPGSAYSHLTELNSEILFQSIGSPGVQEADIDKKFKIEVCSSINNQTDLLTLTII